MATDKQIAANRRNGALSRGPKTAVGKARSSRNALKHGLAIPITRDRATAPENPASGGANGTISCGGFDPERTDRRRSPFRARTSSGGIRAVVARMSISHTSMLDPGIRAVLDPKHLPCRSAPWPS